MSKKTSNFTQCKLVKENTTSIAWIPSTFAIKGKNLEIKMNDAWTYWKVMETFSTVSKQYLDEHRSAYKSFKDVLSEH